MDLEKLAQKYAGYRIEDRSVAIAALPWWVWGLAVILIIIPIVLFEVFAHKQEGSLGYIWLLWTLGLLILHEATHAVAWKFASGLPWSSFTFGVQWKTATPYCHSIEPMSIRAYRIGAISPLIVTGILPWVLAFVWGDVELAMAAAILISGAAGDLYILWAIKDLPDEVLLQDHDTQAGCLVLWPA